VICFALPAPAEVELVVYNLAGQQVASLVQGKREAGSYTVRWDGTDDRHHPLASGVYLLRLRAGEITQSRSVLLLK
jgi:flagellar hook assembly protein FlgD